MNIEASASYPPGVPQRISTPRHGSLGQLLDACCEQYSSNTAFVQDSGSLTYADLRTYGARLAAYLAENLALAAGDRVIVMMPNVLSYPIAICGIFWAGCVVVNVNPMYTAREVRHQIEDSGASAIIVAEPYAKTVKEALRHRPDTPVIVVTITERPAPRPVPSLELPPEWTSLPQVLSQSKGFLRRDRQLDDSALLQYTGGTTGPSKGAELTHANILSNLEQFGLWVANYAKENRESVITALPIYHILAFTVNVLSFFRLGARNILIPNPRDLPALVATMKREGCTAITGVNTLFNGLLNTPGFDDLDFTDLHLCMGGGSAIQPAVARRWLDRTGVKLVEGYGLTETSPVLTVNRFDTNEAGKGIGLPLPSTEISIRDDDGHQLAPGARGELCARGPQVMRGYWNKPEENAKAFFEDGFFRTGDIAYQDAEGYFHIVDRKKDMVLVSGFNVYPNEIEAVCAEHPGVLEAACIGVPDDKTGEAVKIYVVKRDESLTAQSLLDYFRLNLTAYKVPRHVEFVSQLPKSPVGKILRRELRG